MSLESLVNPLERIVFLPTSMNYRDDGAGGIVWDIANQYYVGDVVTSSVDGYAYVYTGATTGRTTVLGGVDPSLSVDWVRLAGAGVTTYDTNTAAVTAVGAAGTYGTLVNNVLTVGAAGDYLVTFQGTVTCPLAQTTADISTFTLTGSAGTIVGSCTCAPNVGSASSTFSFSSRVNVGGAAPFTITAGGVYLGQIPTLSAGQLTAVRLG